MTASDKSSVDTDAPVLIAGGGLVGSTMAMILANHGIKSITVERNTSISNLPRAAYFNLRTLEIFREAGIEEQVRRQSEKEFVPEGALITMDCLAGKKIADIIPTLNEGVEALSPCRRLFISQPGLEPILRARAEQIGASVLEGHEVAGIEQDSTGVTITARSVTDGTERRLRGRYLVGADGAHSKVRDLLGIPFEGRGVFSNSITIYFTADLWPQLGDKPLSVIYINNPALGGFFRMNRDCQSGFLVINTVGDPKTNPDVANAAADISEGRLVEFVRAGAGIPELPVRIDGVSRWRATSDVAKKYREGRVFLAGDSAHLMPPNGGFGGNTGIHDAHNLGWKLALVLKESAGTELLDTYEQERRPVGRFTVEQAYARYVTRTATYLEARDYETVVDDILFELGYNYRSAAIVPEDNNYSVPGDPALTRGRPGSRAPHLWVEKQSDRISMIDLYGRGFVLLIGTDGEDWNHASAAVGKDFSDIDFKIVQIGGNGLRDVDEHFTEVYGITSNGAVLIRPDGFVAWRAETMPEDVSESINRVLQRILGRKQPGSP